MATKPPTSNPPMDQMMMKSLGGPSAVDLRCDRILPWKVHSQHTPATNHPTRCATPNSYATLPYPIGRKEHSLYKLYTYMSMHIVNVGRKNCKGLESLEFEGPHPSHPQKSLSQCGLRANVSILAKRTHPRPILTHTHFVSCEIVIVRIYKKLDI